MINHYGFTIQYTSFDQPPPLPPPFYQTFLNDWDVKEHRKLFYTLPEYVYYTGVIFYGNCPISDRRGRAPSEKLFDTLQTSRVKRDEINPAN